MVNKLTALVVDDEPDLRELIQLSLLPEGVKVIGVGTIERAKELLEQQSFHFCLTDMKLPDGDGLTLIEHIQKHHPDLPVAMMTAYGNIDLAVKAMKQGAFDFICKPLNLKSLRQLTQDALALSAGVCSQKLMPQQACEFWGNHPDMQRIQSLLPKLARSQAPLVLIGESGVGKKWLARIVHQQGGRATQPLIVMNCASLIPPTDTNHLAGSTHIDSMTTFLAQAQGGTLVLEGVHQLTSAMQVALLRLLQDRVLGHGHDKQGYLDVRLIVTTERPLSDYLQAEQLRADLYYQLNVVEVVLPALRERISDLPVLIDQLLSRLVLSSQMPKPVLAAPALKALVQYPFVGNVRELETMLARALTVGDGRVLTLADLHLQDAPLSKPAHTELKHKTSGSNTDDLSGYLDTIAKDTITEALARNRWNKTKTAKELGITLRVLRYRLKRLGIEATDS